MANHEFHLRRLILGAADDAALQTVALALGWSMLAVEEGAALLGLPMED